MIRIENIKIQKNTSKSLSFVIKDDNDNVINLASATGKIKVHLDIPGTNNTYVIDKALTIDSAIRGECSVTLENTDTNIDASIYRVILEFNYAIGDDRVYSYGTFTIYGDDTERLQQIKTKYGLTYDDYTLQTAFDWSHQQMLNNAYQKIEQSVNGTEFKIDNYVMDKNFDGVVDTSDLEIIEYMSSSPYTVNNLNSNISSVVYNHPAGKSYITMDASYPSNSSFKVRVTYYKGSDSHSDLLVDIKRLEELYTLYHLFDILEPHKLQTGITDKTINGVSIVFDQEGIRTFKKDLYNQIQNSILKIKPFDGMFGSVLISKEY